MPRLTRIYTRTGDDGTTGLTGGLRVRKDHARIEVIGEIDELNSVIGIVRALPGEDLGLDAMLASIQHRLFDIGGELSMPGETFARPQWTVRLEHWLDHLNAALPDGVEGNRRVLRRRPAYRMCLQLLRCAA